MKDLEKNPTAAEKNEDQDRYARRTEMIATAVAWLATIIAVLALLVLAALMHGPPPGALLRQGGHGSVEKVGADPGGRDTGHEESAIKRSGI